MKRVEFWRWLVKSDTAPFKMVKTRHHMTEATALARHPEAQRIPGTMELRDLPETPEEQMANTSSAWQRRQSSSS